MIYITGDTHGQFEQIEYFCKNNKTTNDDILIILGDAGINYYGNEQDKKLKEYLSNLSITLFCIHGNHENRPKNIIGYQKKNWNNGYVYYETNYPNILFPIDGSIFNLNKLNCIVIGGAYSVDKYYRLKHGFNWWEDEQPDDRIKNIVEKQILNNHIDVILSHTCPRKYEPVEMFLGFIDQSMVDNSTNDWLDKIEEQVDYKKWYCGHYHTIKNIDKIQFMFNNIEEFIKNYETNNEITKDYVWDIVQGAKNVYGNGIYVKCNSSHPCGWDFIDFSYLELESQNDVILEKISINDISDGNYDYHEYDGLTVFELIKLVGNNGWCFELSEVNYLEFN